MQNHKQYYNYKLDKYITVKEYNRLAQQAFRKGIKTQVYLEEKGWIKLWGNKTKEVV